MTRRAVQDFLRDNPDHLPTSANAPFEQISDNASDSHPYNRPLQVAYVGSLAVFTFLDDPAKYYLDLWSRQPASPEQAVAAFGREAIAEHRRMAEDLAVQRWINDAADDAVRARDEQKTPEELREERTAALRAQAAKAVRKIEAKAQRAADKQLTHWLDKEAPLPSG
jgi:hypothetical protein